MEQTDTRQFKRWFGKSKVVNADGKTALPIPSAMWRGKRVGRKLDQRRTATLPPEGCLVT